MLVVRVELHSAITGQTTEIARSLIFNDGEGSHTKGSYKAFAFKGRDGEPWTRDQIKAAHKNQHYLREGVVTDYPRLSLHVWNLVARALASMGYR